MPAVKRQLVNKLLNSNESTTSFPIEESQQITIICFLNLVTSNLVTK